MKNSVLKVKLLQEKIIIIEKREMAHLIPLKTFSYYMKLSENFRKTDEMRIKQTHYDKKFDKFSENLR